VNRLSPWAFDDLARGRESVVDVESSLVSSTTGKVVFHESLGCGCFENSNPKTG
jgi:hypothetical protein